MVLGVDLGSSSARALGLDPSGRVLARAVRSYDAEPRDTAEPRDDQGLVDPRVWQRAIERALAEIIGQLGTRTRPAAVCVGGQSPAVVVGRTAVTPRHPAGAELDPAAQHAAQLNTAREAGSRAAQGSSPNQAEQGRAGTDASGREAERLRPSDHEESARQALDWVPAQWMVAGAAPLQSRWPGEPELAGFGRLVPAGSVLGEIAGGVSAAGRPSGLPSGTLLVAGAPDAFLAFWAGGLIEPGRAMDVGGRTGGFGLAVAARTLPAGLFSLRSAVVDVDVVGSPVNAHGTSLEWLATITGRGVPELVELAGSAAPGAGGVLLLPYLEGERGPRWRRDLTGELVGLRSSTTVAHLARAVLEGTAFGIRHIADTLADRGLSAETVLLAGSQATSGAWAQVKADVLGVPVLVSHEPQLAAYGAALAAGAGAGWWRAPGAGAGAGWPLPFYDVVDPRPHPVYRAAYLRWVALGDAAVARLTTR